MDGVVQPGRFRGLTAMGKDVTTTFHPGPMSFPPNWKSSSPCEIMIISRIFRGNHDRGSRQTRAQRHRLQPRKRDAGDFDEKTTTLSGKTYDATEYPDALLFSDTSVMCDTSELNASKSTKQAANFSLNDLKLNYLIDDSATITIKKPCSRCWTSWLRWTPIHFSRHTSWNTRASICARLPGPAMVLRASRGFRNALAIERRPAPCRVPIGWALSVTRKREKIRRLFYLHPRPFPSQGSGYHQISYHRFQGRAQFRGIHRAGWETTNSCRSKMITLYYGPSQVATTNRLQSNQPGMAPTIPRGICPRSHRCSS